MGVDDPGDDIAAGRVDDLHARGDREVVADLFDDPPDDQNIPLEKLAVCHRQDRAVLDQKVAGGKTRNDGGQRPEGQE